MSATKKSKVVRGTCGVCGNECFYDNETIKGDTYTLNGRRLVVCSNCVEDLIKTLHRRKDIRIDKHAHLTWSQ